ncbi:MAG: c-type cytochrome [Chromatiales bacterium]
MKQHKHLWSLALITALYGVAPGALADDRKHTVEFDQAIQLEPDLENGKRLYRNCIACHGPEGWGTPSGAYPQIAGQLKNVIIKQLADIRAGNRDNPIMRAFTSRRLLSDAQDIADVAGYIAAMPMTPYNDKGPHLVDNSFGEKLYQDNCTECHGERGEGDIPDAIPSLYGQHYSYLLRQFEWIRSGQRRNADEKMTKQILNFHLQEEVAVLSYTANLPLPADKAASDGWTNPDFPHVVRHQIPGLAQRPHEQRP